MLSGECSVSRGATVLKQAWYYYERASLRNTSAARDWGKELGRNKLMRTIITSEVQLRTSVNTNITCKPSHLESN